MSTNTSPSTTLRSKPFAIVATILGLGGAVLFARLGLSPASRSHGSSNSLERLVASLALALSYAFVFLRSAYAKLVIREDGVKVVGLLRTRMLRWREIREFKCLRPGSTAVAHLVNGKMVYLFAISVVSGPWLQQRVEELNHILASKNPPGSE